LVVTTRAVDAEAAREAAHAMCERLLANPVTEDFEIEQVVPLAASRVGA
jgi:phosphoribosylformylglycinamidine synthase